MNPTTPAEMLKLLGDILQGGEIWDGVVNGEALADALLPLDNMFSELYPSLVAACEEVE